MKVYVSEGNIEMERPYYLEPKDVHLLDITFKDCTSLVSNWGWRKAGETEEEAAKWYTEEFLPDLEKAKIANDTRVTVLSNENREVLAICSAETPTKWWIDGKDLKCKKFEQLNINITQIIHA